MRVPGQTSATAPGAATNAITIIRPGVIILRAEHFSGLSHRSLGHGVVTTVSASFYLTTRGHAGCWSESQKKSTGKYFFLIKYSFPVWCFVPNPCFHDGWSFTTVAFKLSVFLPGPCITYQEVMVSQCPSVAYKRYRRWHPDWGQSTPADGPTHQSRAGKHTGS